MKIALPLALSLVVLIAFSFHAADAIVSGQSAAAQHYKEYPYNLLVPFFTVVCSTLLITLVIHYYREQLGRKSIITE
jgi:hypothetical protein